MTLTGSVALVTGASRGLGRAIATRLAREGAFVYGTYATRSAEAERTARTIASEGGQAVMLPLDARRGEEARATVARVLDEKGRIDVLVNNAGVCRDQHLALMTDEQWDDVITTNLCGPAALCRAVIRPMMAARAGSIVNVASVAALHASPGQANYAASKGALLALTRTLAAEVARHGVRVNAVVPGMIATGMVERMNRRAAEDRRQSIAMQRFGEPEDVAAAVAFLASSQASYVTGAQLVIDGGLSL